MKRSYAELRRSTEQILETADDEMRTAIRDVADAKERPEWVKKSADALSRLTEVSPNEGAVDFERETIVQRVGRPVLTILQGQAELVFQDPASEIWRNRLQSSTAGLAPVIAAIGRIEVVNHPFFEYVGTGWLVAEDLVVTNRHVALEFAERVASGWKFQLGFDRRSPIDARIDFLEEQGNVLSAEVPISEVLFVAGDGGPDVAFLRLRPAALGTRPRVVPLATETAPARTVVATIGYPARDTRIPERELMDKIFGGVYDKKRMSPGFVTGIEPATLLHDCTTLGGNSGSALIDLATGQAVGLHFAGTFLRANYAVAAPAISALVREAREAKTILSSGGTAGAGQAGGATGAATTGTAGTATLQAVADGGGMRLTVPVEITVKFGTPSGVPGGLTTTTGVVGPGAIGAKGTTVTKEQVERAVALARQELAARADVVSIEAGWRFRDGWITDERAVVIAVRRKYEPEELAARGQLPLPSEVAGVPVDVTFASARDLLAIRGEGLEAAGHWVSHYQPRPDLPLVEVDEPMKVSVSASPDAGWPQLEAFLGRTEKRLAIGMYDFTAPHVIGAVEQAAKAKRPLKLVLQASESLDGGTKKDDIPDAETIAQIDAAKTGGFEWAWAPVSGPQRLFDSAYHIKVAVRDGEEFWLSSGNWQSSNQPPFDPIDDVDDVPPILKKYNREWHAVVEHEGLAKLFEAHLERDLADAVAAAIPETRPEPMLWVPIEYFQPTTAELEAPVRYVRPLSVDRRVRVQPLLTPDNYAEHVLALVQSAQQRLYFENQSLSILAENSAKYQDLVEALRARQQAGVDVRVIIRRIGDLRTTVTRIRDFGLDTDRLRLLTNCHTKGIVVDGERTLLGSHNWTNSGTVFNRDASLIFFDPEIARYYEQLFLYDWSRAGRPRVDESVPTVEWATGEESRPRPGKVRVPLREWLGL